MKFALGPRAVVVAAALASFAVVGCNPPLDEPKVNPSVSTSRSSGRGRSAPAQAPSPDVAKPAEGSPTSSDAAKPVDSAPAPKVESKKEEAPKEIPK